MTAIFAGDRWIGIEPGDTTAESYGVAVDIGTTTVVASLIHLGTGEAVAMASMLNPQKAYGLDVLTRIQHVRSCPEDLPVLSHSIREGIDGLIGDACSQAEVDRDRIYEVCVAANSTMTHLFLGVDPSSLGVAPYVPVFTDGVTVPAQDVGLHIAPGGTAFCLPAVSGYIGGDIVAGLLSSELAVAERPSLLIDIGTNGEIVLASGGRLFGCSCAAGPALEGMNIQWGMRAAEGAIERVVIGDDAEVATIGGRPPEGICGSGIIDAVAELVKVGAIGPTGRFTRIPEGTPPLPWHARLRHDGGSRFVLCRGADGAEIAVTQRDVRQVQLAKGAILSGILALTAQLGVGLGTLETVYVAGAFGHHVRKESLARLGILPRECLNRAVAIGNSSQAGAMLALLSREKRRLAGELARRVEYVELSCQPGYDRLFADSLAFREAGR